MSSCQACLTKLSRNDDVIQCSELKCNKLFHIKCANITPTTFIDLKHNGKVKEWVCEECGNDDVDNITLKDVFMLLKDIKQDQRGVKQQLNDVIKSQEYLSSKYDEFENKFKMLEETKKDVEVMKNQLTYKIEDLSNRLAHTEQYSRRHHVEIHNVKTRSDEDLHQVVVNIAGKLGINITRDAVETVHRMYTNSSVANPPIIVEFASRKLRDRIIESRYKAEVTNKSLFGNSFDGNRIFVSESLSPFYKKLLWETKKVCKEKSYDYCWYKNFKILVRKNKSENITTIVNMNDLSKIK